MKLQVICTHLAGGGRDITQAISIQISYMGQTDITASIRVRYNLNLIPINARGGAQVDANIVLGSPRPYQDIVISVCIDIPRGDRKGMSEVFTGIAGRKRRRRGNLHRTCLEACVRTLVKVDLVDSPAKAHEQVVESILVYIARRSHLESEGALTSLCQLMIRKAGEGCTSKVHENMAC